MHLGWSNARHETKLGEECLKGSPAERDLGLTGGSTGISSVCPGRQQGKPQPGVHHTQHHQPVKRGDWMIISVFSAGAVQFECEDT